MNAVRLGDVLDPEKNLREWAKRGGPNPQKGSPAAAMQWAVAEIERLRDHQRVLSDRCARKEIELDELRSLGGSG